MSKSSKLSKASNGLTWQQNKFVDMRLDNAYISTMDSLASALSYENVDWLLGPIAGWGVVLNTPIECGTNAKGKIVGRHQLWNCAAKARWMTDSAVYGHIQTKAYVEHPYEKQPTKDFIVEGVLEARKRGLNSSIIKNQVAEIIDARLDCVLVPSDPNDSQPHPSIKGLIGNKKDGMVQKYSQIALVDHDTEAKLTLADLQKADDDMQRRVETAMTILKGTTWVFPSSSVAAKPKPIVTITPTKKSNPATTLHKHLPQVRETDLRAAMIKMGIDPDSPANPGRAGIKNGYSYRAKAAGKNIMTYVNLNGKDGYSSGRFEVLPDQPRFRSLTLKEFDDHVATIVQEIQRGVY